MTFARSPILSVAVLLSRVAAAPLDEATRKLSQLIEINTTDCLVVRRKKSVGISFGFSPNRIRISSFYDGVDFYHRYLKALTTGVTVAVL